VEEITPDRLEQTILSIARSQPPGQRESVMLNSLWDALVGGGPLAPGTKGWEAYLAFKQAIARLVAQIPGMSFIEADS